MPVQSTRRLAALLVALAAALALAGCGQVNATVETTQALARAGVEDAVVAIENDGDLTTVNVDYRSRAVSLGGFAAEQDRVAGIVWRNAELDLDLIRLDHEGGPAEARPSRTYDRAELVARFGPRPTSLERPRTSPWLFTAGVLLAIFVIVVVVAAGGVIWFLYFRRRRAAQPPWLAGSGYPGWDGYEPRRGAPPAPPPAPPASYPPATPGHPGYPQARGRARPAAEPSQPAPAGQAPGAGRAPVTATQQAQESWPAEDDAPTKPGPDAEPPAGQGRR